MENWPSRGGIPCRQRRLRVAQRVGSRRTGTPQGRVPFLARGLHEQDGIAPDQGTQVQAVSEIQVLLRLHKPHPSPRRAPAASEYFPRIVHRRVRETPVIDLMQDAF